jgi:hypothetical protein
LAGVASALRAEDFILYTLKVWLHLASRFLKRQRVGFINLNLILKIRKGDLLRGCCGPKGGAVDKINRYNYLE